MSSLPETKESNNDAVDRETVAPRWITEEPQENGHSSVLAAGQQQQQQQQLEEAPAATKPVETTNSPPPQAPSTSAPPLTNGPVESQLELQPQRQVQIQPQTMSIQPATPPRTYPRQQLSPVAFVGGPRPRDYRTLERFFNGLVSVLAWSGALSGVVYILFKTVIFPRLSLRYARLGMIYRFHEEKYLRICDMLKNIAMKSAKQEGGTMVSFPLLPKTYSVAKKEIEKKQQGGEQQVDKAEENKVEGEENTQKQEEEKPLEKGHIKESMSEMSQLLDELKQNIKELPAAKEYGDKSSKIVYDDDNERGEAVRLLWSMQQTGNLVSMLNYDAVTSISERAAGIPSAFGLSSTSMPPSSPDGSTVDLSTTRAFERAASELRTEIRGMKGYLLSRRNFALAARAA